MQFLLNGFYIGKPVPWRLTPKSINIKKYVFVLKGFLRIYLIFSHMLSSIAALLSSYLMSMQILLKCETHLRMKSFPPITSQTTTRSCFFAFYFSQVV